MIQILHGVVDTPFVVRSHARVVVTIAFDRVTVFRLQRACRFPHDPVPAENPNSMILSQLKTSPKLTVSL